MRNAEISRKTLETDINLSLCLDGGKIEINTGIGFFDHMLTAFATHGKFGLVVNCKGDLKVDCHHTVEDIGIVLGQAFAEALGDKSNIDRFGSFFVPMDESLVLAAVDISGRPFLIFDVDLPSPLAGDFESDTAVEFFRAFATNAGITLHIKQFYGANTHHILEAVFKSAAHALRFAVKQNDDGILSSKGSL